MAKLSLKEVRSALGLQFLILIGRCNKLISSQHLITEDVPWGSRDVT